MSSCIPPFTITARMLSQVSLISKEFSKIELYEKAIKRNSRYLKSKGISERIGSAGGGERKRHDSGDAK